MMATILTLMITAMIFQGVMAVVDSVLGMVNFNSLIGSIPVLGDLVNRHMQLIWAYLFVMITQEATADAIHVEYGASMDILGIGTHGEYIAMAIAIIAFISVKDAAIKALGQGFAR
ncbi:MAG: hypothetical protein CL512_01790 [Actinobacteria bacterium]|nr:hypothetical protein [Actinomycetota bacterium]|tara:strand:- start:67 stop:414 length:348 start_codon:yes stop_codon:yes gene_type:complete